MDNPLFDTPAFAELVKTCSAVAVDRYRTAVYAEGRSPQEAMENIIGPIIKEAIVSGMDILFSAARERVQQPPTDEAN